MVSTIGGIPVFDALITDEETGMFKISLVDEPAVMSNFLAFDNTKKRILYSIESEEKRLVRGCIMRCDFPIYRRDENLGEYYVIYKAEQIRKMAEKYLSESRQNNVNLMHEADSDVKGVQMVQYFIKGNGVSVEGFDDCADGSLFGEFHITNDAIWEQVKEGVYKGFSLEGVFELAPEQKLRKEKVGDILEEQFKRINKQITEKTMSKLSKLREALAKALQEFGNITTDGGILSWDGDEDLTIGDAVYIEDAEGNRLPAEDKEYKTDDNKIIVVVDGKVADIKDAEIEVIETPEENPVEVEEKKKQKCEGEEETQESEPEPETPEEDKDAKIKELEEKVAELEEKNKALEEENASLKSSVQEMEKMSIAKPAHEVVETSATFKRTGNKGLDRIAELMSK